MYNDRVLIVIGKDNLGYISKFDESLVLPFEQLARIPNRKVIIPFDRIIHC
jgi:hypothetical protein